MLTYVTLVGDLECAGTRHLVEALLVLVLVRDQVAVEVVVQVRLRNLVSHGNCIWDELHDSAGH